MTSCLFHAGVPKSIFTYCLCCMKGLYSFCFVTVAGWISMSSYHVKQGGNASQIVLFVILTEKIEHFDG